MHEAAMNKYRKVPKPKESTPMDEIRVTGMGKVINYVTYAAKLFNEMQRNSITIRATGKAVSTAVSVAEVVKRRFKGLHQLTTIGCTQLVNEYEPLEEGLDKIEETRTVSFISIQLARDNDAENLSQTAPGYQAPLDEALVKELDPVQVSRSLRGRPRGRGRGGNRGGFFGGSRGRGRGRGRRGGPPMNDSMRPHSPPPMMSTPGYPMYGNPYHDSMGPGGHMGFSDNYPQQGGRRGRGRGRGGFRGSRGRGGYRGGRGRGLIYDDGGY